MVSDDFVTKLYNFLMSRLRHARRSSRRRRHPPPLYQSSMRSGDTNACVQPTLLIIADPSLLWGPDKRSESSGSPHQTHADTRRCACRALTPTRLWIDSSHRLHWRGFSHTSPAALSACYMCNSPDGRLPLSLMALAWGSGVNRAGST